MKVSRRGHVAAAVALALIAGAQWAEAGQYPYFIPHREQVLSGSGPFVDAAIEHFEKALGKLRDQLKTTSEKKGDTTTFAATTVSGARDVWNVAKDGAAAKSLGFTKRGGGGLTADDRAAMVKALQVWLDDCTVYYDIVGGYMNTMFLRRLEVNQYVGDLGRLCEAAEPTFEKLKGEMQWADAKLRGLDAALAQARSRSALKRVEKDVETAANIVRNIRLSVIARRFLVVGYLGKGRLGNLKKWVELLASSMKKSEKLSAACPFAAGDYHPGEYTKWLEIFADEHVAKWITPCEKAREKALATWEPLIGQSLFEDMDSFEGYKFDGLLKAVELAETKVKLRRAELKK